MALGIYFVHMGFTPDKYDEAIKKLDAAAFGPTLIPILAELGVELAEPSIAEIHNSIAG